MYFSLSLHIHRDLKKVSKGYSQHSIINNLIYIFCCFLNIQAFKTSFFCAVYF